MNRRDFYSWSFSWIIFPQAPENSPKVISNFSNIRGDIRKSRCTTGIKNTRGKFANGVNDTGGKIATGINNTGGKICQLYQHHMQKISPPVPLELLIPVVHLDLWISPRIFEKFEMTLVLFLGAWGKMIHEKHLM
jgi:hypothetical protein